MDNTLVISLLSKDNDKDHSDVVDAVTVGLNLKWPRVRFQATAEGPWTHIRVVGFPLREEYSAFAHGIVCGIMWERGDEEGIDLKGV